MRSTNTVYVTTPAEYDKHREKLKLVACPRCHTVGCLIRHGYLEGHGDKANDKVRRGWRVFCSNRNLRKGCGKTYSVLLAEFLFRRMVGASRIWSFLRGVIGGLSRKAAWESVSSPFSPDTGYRLWTAFRTGQTFIRSALLRAGAAPKMNSPDPDLQVIEHLQFVFSNAACPVSGFQVRFQSAFLNARTPRINKSG